MHIESSLPAIEPFQNLEYSKIKALAQKESKIFPLREAPNDNCGKYPLRHSYVPWEDTCFP